jgi:hypothetical protein
MSAGTRAFAGVSALGDGGLGLALAPALTPSGVVERPGFFHGFATEPVVLARGLLALADVTSTRYFRFVPESLRDPVLTANGDRLRAEVFSACNGVYARLDLLDVGFDGGEIGHGTTNVDIGPELRSALTRIGHRELLHLDVGDEGLSVSTIERTERERRVAMPDRWVRALGNAAASARDLVPLVELDRSAARRFVAALPSATGKSVSGFLHRGPSGPVVGPRGRPGSVHVSGLHRLSAVKRLLVDLHGLRAYGPESPSSDAPSLIEFTLPAARLTLALTSQSWRGFSGEGSLLSALAEPQVLDDADLVAAVLAFEPVLRESLLAAETGLSVARVRGALAVLATSGRVGWDAFEGDHFHRELPDDPARLDRDNPRLVAARRIVAANGVCRPCTHGDSHTVRSGSQSYLVQLDGGAPGRRDLTFGATCTCTWYLHHLGSRGPCKHVLAVQLLERGESVRSPGEEPLSIDEGPGGPR